MWRWPFFRKPQGGVARTQKVRGLFWRELNAIEGSIFHHLIYPLTSRVVGAPQMISQPVSSLLNCPLGLGELQACPFPDVVFPPLPLSARFYIYFKTFPGEGYSSACYNCCREFCLSNFRLPGSFHFIFVQILFKGKVTYGMHSTLDFTCQLVTISPQGNV